MNIVMITGGFYPRFSATGNCMAKIASELNKKHHLIVVSEKKDISETDYDEWNNQLIFRVNTKRIQRRLSLINQGQDKFLVIHKLYWFFRCMLNKYFIDITLVDAYKRKIEYIQEDFRIDAVLACCMPIEGVFAAYEFCKLHSIKFVPVLFDLYSDSDIFFRISLIKKIKHNAALELEKKFFSEAYHIFYVDNWKNYFLFRDFKKATLIEHPLIEKKILESKTKLKNKSKISLLYLGEVNWEIRNPKNTILAFKKLVSMDVDNLLKIHVCSFGNAYSEFEKLKEELPQFVELYGKVSKNIADAYAEDTDVNIVISNSNPNIVPSKIYECIASGKPVVYFYSNMNDKPVEVLSKYPNKYLFKLDNYDESGLQKLYRWVCEEYMTKIEFEQLDNSYACATPEFIAKVIMEEFK